MNVYLLTRKGKKGKSTYYLSYAKGKIRKYQFLKLWVYTEPKDAIERAHNKSIMQLAKTIHSQAVIDCQYTEHHMVSPIKGKIGLLTYFERVMATKDECDGTHGTWKSCHKHLKAYTGNTDIPLEKVDDTFVSGFQDYLLKLKIRGGKILSRNTALSYFIKLKVALKDAYMKKFIRYNPSATVKCIRSEDTVRGYVSMDEIRSLHQTECKLPILKSAYLFACFTGMRCSDIKSLTWGQIAGDDEKGYHIRFRQQKTKGNELLPLSSEAFKIIAAFGHREGTVFQNLQNTAYTNKLLRKWFQSAGITRHLTFHSSRHSFATNLLASKATDIYTVSKLLGHRRISTSEIYTHVLQQSKIDAVNQLTL